MVIWLIGMSASGKTTIGKKLYEKLSQSDEKWIFLDGDTFRNILGEDLGHTIEDREKNAYRISRFCEFLSSQNINVIACVLSIFHENQKYNKNNIPNYKEVYIDVTFDNLLKRDNKELYTKALNGEIQDVVGVDIEFKPPYSPDLIIDNNTENQNFDEITRSIINTFQIKINSVYSYTSNNLLEYPHKYQYSEFLGNDFFTLYKNDRKKGIKFFEKRLNKLHINDIGLKASSYMLNDNLVLKDFLIHLLQSNQEELEKQKEKIALLIKRFEVGKKLYLTYDLKDIRKSSLEFEDLLNYPLFSLVLQKYFMYASNQEKLIYLNATLKLNDIISSVKSDFILSDELTYALKAFNEEIKIMEEYL